MRYPTLTRTKCTELAQQLLEGLDPSVEAAVNWAGKGDDVDLRAIAAAADEITAEAREWTDRDKDRFEGKVCTQLFQAVSSLPTEVLDDRGFWRYLGLKYFWEFIAWREEEPFARGNYGKYVDATAPTESVLTRMYLRAQAVGGPDHADLASAIPMGTDFWRSHVLRVRTGSAPPVTRAFAQKQATQRAATDTLRNVGRRLNRLWTNVALHTYDDAAASTLIDELWRATNDN
jgi:hypothetical protein